MKNAKLLKFAAAIIVLALFVYGVVAAIRSSPAGNKPAGNSGKTLDIPTSKGQVQVKDFNQELVKKVQDTSVVSDTAYYSIAYFDQEKTFTIVLQAKPLQKARDEAEQAFLDKLQISKGDACKLQVSLGVPYGLDSSLAGRDFGLSFCPNGLPLP